MSVSSGVITAPVSVEDVCDALEITYNSTYADVGFLCTRSAINPWARFKPTSGGDIASRKLENSTYPTTNKNKCVIYGLAYYNSSNVFTARSNVIGSLLTTNSFSVANCFNLTQQNLNYYRLHDFNGYDHNATFNLGDDRYYKCFPDTNEGGQTGFFYNKEETMLQWYSVKPVSNITQVPYCYEDASGTSYASCKALYVEDIVSAATSPDLGAYDFGNYIFGVAFKIGSYLYLLSTGVTINILLNGSSTEIQIQLTSGVTNYNAGRLMYGGGSCLLMLNLSVLNSYYKAQYGGSAIFTDGVTCNARSVLINYDGLGIIFERNPSYDIYAFCPDKLSDNTYFGMRTNFTIKKLMSYVNVTTKTNRTNNTTRNAGRFLGRNSSSYTTCEYEYVAKNNIYDWYQKSSESHPPYKYTTYCYLSFDSTRFYTLTPDSTGQHATVANWSGSGLKFVRYRLRLSGFVCDEFRTKTNTNTNFINTENQENVVKYSNLYLRIGKSKFNSALYTWIYYNNAGEKAELFSTNDVNIGSSDSYPYGYAWTSNVSTGNVAHCTKDYNNESGDFSKCHSSLMNLNQINNVKKPNGDLIKDYSGINTSTDYVYIYVMADAFSASSGSNPDPKEFTLNIEYTFGPVDTISNGVVTQTTESITVYDASDNNTTISVSGSPSWPT